MSALHNRRAAGWVRTFAAALLAALGAVSVPAGAYSITGGDLLLRPVVGVSVNVLRFPAATRATPSGGMLLGIDLDWALDPSIGFTAQLRPVASPGFVDLGLGLGMKYRVSQLGAPFIPYASLAATTALGAPLGAGSPHYNLGGRLAAGTDYFVMRDLAVGVEVGFEVSALLTPIASPEATVDALVGLSWRL